MLLFVSVMLLVLMFRSSSALASAYGISVTGTMVVTAMMGFVVIWKVWKWSPVAAAALIAPFLFSRPDLSRGQPVESIRGRLGAAGARRCGDTADVHLAARQPAAVRENAQAGVSARRSGVMLEKKPPQRFPHRRVPDQRSRQRADRPDAQPPSITGLHEKNVILTIETAPTPRIDPAERVRLEQISETFSRVTLPVGFMESPNVPKSAGDRAETRLAIRHHVDLVFLSRRALKAGRAFRDAALAGSTFYRAQPHRHMTHRLFPDPERSGGRGRNAGDI